jgi:hypothetical protein
VQRPNDYWRFRRLDGRLSNAGLSASFVAFHILLDDRLCERTGRRLSLQMR